MFKFLSFITLLIYGLSAIAQVQGNREEMLKILQNEKTRYKKQIPTNKDGLHKLRVTTLNAGLLNTLFIKVPDYRKRSKAFTKTLDEHSKEYGPDIIFFQEVWHNPDIQKLKKYEGYKSMAASGKNDVSHNQNQTGLDILIKDESIKEVLKSYFEPYSNSKDGSNIRSNLEKLGNYKRGALISIVVLKNGKKVAVLNTHLTPIYSNLEIRKKQLKELARIVNDLKEEVDTIILGSDFNVSPLWERMDDDRKLDGPSIDWDRNAKLFEYFVGQSSMIDVYNAINNDEGYTQDPLINSITNISSSTKNEPRQRLDYIFVWSKGGVEVDDSFRSFTEKTDAGVEASDHVGVSGTIRY